MRSDFDPSLRFAHIDIVHTLCRNFSGYLAKKLPKQIYFDISKQTVGKSFLRMMRECSKYFLSELLNLSLKMLIFYASFRRRTKFNWTKSTLCISSVTTSFTAVLPIVIMTINKDILKAPHARFCPFSPCTILRPGHDLFEQQPIQHQVQKGDDGLIIGLSPFCICMLLCKVHKYLYNMPAIATKKY